MRNTTATAIGANIVLTWSQAMSTATLTNGTVRVHGSMSGLYTTSAVFSYSNGNTQVSINPASNFHYGEQISITVTNAQSSAGVAMTRATVWGFTTAAAGGTGVMGIGWSDPASSSHTRSVALGDLDGDGDLDIYTGNAGTGDFDQVWKNDGTGNFVRTWTGNTSQSSEIKLGDLDSDGDLDVYEAGNMSASRAWKNDGSGSFTALWVSTMATSVYNVELGDIDGDGNLDAVETNGAPDYSIRVRKNNGNGNFSDTWVSLNSTTSAWGMALGDFDGDGDLDIFQGGTVDRLWKNDGAGSFTITWTDSGAEPGTALAIDAGDVDGDGDLDIVEGRPGYYRRVLNNNGAGSFTETWRQSTAASSVCSLVLGDLDGDSDLDMYETNNREGNSVDFNRIWTNDGTGNLTSTSQTFGSIGSASAVRRAAALGDVNGDGWLDIVEGGAGFSSTSPFGELPTRVWLNISAPRILSVTPSVHALNTALSTSPTITFNTCMDAASLTTATIKMYGSQTGWRNCVFTTQSGEQTALTLDPVRDVLPGERITIAISGSVRHAGNQTATRATVISFTGAAKAAQGTMLPVWSESAGSATAVVVAGDLDCDGDVDLIQGNYGQPNSVWRNDGSSGFTNSWTESGSSSATTSIVLADFDADGDLDMFEGNNSQPNRLWKNNGSGTFTSAWVQSGYFTATSSLAVGDLDGDTDLDIYEGNDGQWNKVWVNSGNGNFTNTWSDGLTMAATKSVAVGDIDNDGDLDLFEGNRNEPNRVWKNNGSGNFANMWSQAGVALATASVAMEDFDGDGDLDIFAGNSDQLNALWKNDGTGSFTQYWTESSDGSSTRSVAAADIDSDGDMDIVESNGGQPNRVFTNNGSGSFTLSLMQGNTSNTVSIAIADFDGDEDLDFFCGNSGQPTTLWKKEIPHIVITSVPPLPVVSGRQAEVTVQMRHDGGIPMFMPSDTVVTLLMHHTSILHGTFTTQATIYAGQSSTTLTITIVSTTTSVVTVPFSVTLADTSSLMTSASIQLGANNRPYIGFSQSSYQFLEDSSTVVTVQISDVETPVTSLTVSMTSTLWSVLPDSNIVLLETTRSTTSQTMRFRITSTPNSWGSYSLQMTVNDGTYHQVMDIPVNTIAVNDPPSFTTGANITAYDADSLQRINNWAANASAGPGESQIINFIVSNNNPALFTTQPAIVHVSGTGRLDFTPRPNTIGTAVVTVYALDNGGTANGGVNASTRQTFTITILLSPPSTLRSRFMHSTVRSGDTVTVIAEAITRLGQVRPVTQATVVSLDSVISPYISMQRLDTQATIPAGGISAILRIVPFNVTTSTVTLNPVMRTTLNGTPIVITGSVDVTRAVPVGLGVALSNNVPRLTWNVPNAGGITGYSVYRRTGIGALVEIGRTTATVYVDSSAMPGQTYGYAVRTMSGNYLSGLTSIVNIGMPGFTLVSPNGTEDWQFGEVHMILWNSVGTIATVTLEYSTNNGSSWSTIATVPNSGSYRWVLPPVSSTEALVRISNTASDVSDAAFTLRPVTTLTISAVQTTVATTYCVGSPVPVQFDVYLADPTVPVTMLSVTVTSANQNLITDEDIVVQGATGAVTSMVAALSTTATGETTLVIAVSNGFETASTTLTLKANVYPIPVADITGSTTGCRYYESTFSVPAVEEGIYKWTITGAEFTGKRDSNTVKVRWISPGPQSVSVAVTVDSLCSSSANFDVLVSQYYEPQILIGFNCDYTSDSLSLTAKPDGMQYLWSNGATTQTITVASVLEYYSVSVTNEYGCTNFLGRYVYRPTPPVADAGPDMTVCTTTPVTLYGSADAQIGILSYSWSPTAGLSNPFISNPIVEVTTTTTYTLLVTDSAGCTASDNITVFVEPQDVMVATSQSICLGSNMWLWASGGTEYHWSPAYGLSSITGNSITASPSTTTTYTVAITTGDGCVIEKQVTVAIIPPYTIEFDKGRTIALCLGESGQFGVIPDADSYSWWPQDGLSDPYSADPVITALTTGATCYTIYAYYTTSNCVTVSTVCVLVPHMQLDIDVLLEGTWGSDTMAANLQAQNYLPYSQPFGTDFFSYSGGETLSGYRKHLGIVDWVLVELRDALSPTTVIDRRAALLRSDGQIVDPYGPELLGFYNQAAADSFYVVVWHRNHLGIMSALPVSITNSGCTAVYDFTASATAAYNLWGSGQTQLPGGRYGMMAGDNNTDGIVNAVDRVAVRNTTGQTGYLMQDLSLDGIVNAIDRVLVRRNSGRISQVP